MGFYERFFGWFGKAFVPDSIRPGLRKYLVVAGLTSVPYALFGLAFWLMALGTAVSFFAFVRPWLTKSGYSGISLLLASFGMSAVVLLLLAGLLMSAFYFYFDLRIYKRTKDIESVLDEFLQYVSEGLKGGLTFDRALWVAARPQFTVLAAEVRTAAKKAITGEDVESALVELKEKYRSKAFDSTLALLIEGLRGGTEMAPVVDRIIENLRETKRLKERIYATVLSFIIFISIIVIGIAPALFAMSKQILIMLGSFATQVGTALAGVPSAPLRFSGINISPDDFQFFAYLALGTIASFASMILSLIQHGDIKGGIKYVPLFALGALASYFLFEMLSGELLAAFFGAA